MKVYCCSQGETQAHSHTHFLSHTLKQVTAGSAPQWHLGTDTHFHQGTLIDGSASVCVFVITHLPINEIEMLRHQRRDFSQTLLLILTLDSHVHTPAKLLIGQLLGFRSGPAQREKRDGLQPSMGDSGNYCTLSHLAEVFTKLI